ncbi:hypothetical protein GPEL0_01r0465 [Geoanaerobacter pelophilus]|uniref:Uncharacterized protein n=1 Tax=Geoanaerobacter pelophilus TaxID=60036 RepID=A0ABQ0MEJ7_9BACT|nr:hypothetical protein [Geoanaerobacter pelophilus]GAW65530.1 hypothetical protein GPEL0_01r0465 [Geoanaerobacter pelophilus]
MSKENKPLCKWDKDEIKENLKELKKLVAEPRFICRKCARAARSEALLCKPEPLDENKGGKKPT